MPVDSSGRPRFDGGVPAPPDQLFLRPTVIAGTRYADDYEVMWDGIAVGRILKQPGMPYGRPNWSWGVIFPHLPQQAWQRGIESDLEECKRRFKVAWSDVHGRLTEADVALARQQAVNSRKRWKS